MKFVSNIVNGSKKYVKKAGLKIVEKSPELMLIGGIGLVITGTVVLCKKGACVRETLDEHAVEKEIIADDKAEVIECADPETEGELIQQAEKKYRKELACLYRKTGVAVTKDIAVGVGLEMVGIALILGSYGIMKRRSACLMAAYEGLSASFGNYRQRVREEVGIEKENDIWNGRKSVTVVEEEIDPETGRKKKVKKEVKKTGSMNCGWIFSPEYAHEAEGSYYYDENRVRYCQDFISNKLKTEGVILQNDFLDYLGFDRTSEGCVMGIRYGAETDAEGNPKDFDIGMWVEEVVDDETGILKKVIHLNPNFDVMPVWEYIGKCKKY